MYIVLEIPNRQENGNLEKESKFHSIDVLRIKLSFLLVRLKYNTTVNGCALRRSK